MEKLLSIIVPSYNMEKYLPRCLGSLIVDDAALLQKLDVIVVNDGSKDRTSAIAHEFAGKYPGVFVVVDKTNGHYGSCINAGLPRARGMFLKVLDADDFVITSEFQNFLIFLDEMSRKHSDPIDLIIADYEEVSPEGLVLDLKTVPFLKEGVSRVDSIPCEGWTRFDLHSVVYRSAIFREFNYHQTEGVPYTDTEWVIEPMIRVKKLYYWPHVVTQYLIGREGQTVEHRIFAEHFQVLLDLTHELVRRYESNLKNCVPAAREYYLHQVVTMVKYSYEIMIFGLYGYKARGDLIGFDKRLKPYRYFYDQAGEMTHECMHCRLRVVVEWRRHCTTRTMRFVLFRMANWTARCICSPMRRLLAK